MIRTKQHTSKLKVPDGWDTSWFKATGYFLCPYKGRLFKLGTTYSNGTLFVPDLNASRRKAFESNVSHIK